MLPFVEDLEDVPVKCGSGKLCLLLMSCSLLVLQPSGLSGQGLSPSNFHIEILDGEGALNNVKGRVAREPIVQVEDENHKPVAGATVLFEIAGGGPGGTFANGATTLSTVTDAAGRAVAKGLVNNGLAGKYTIHVQVTYQGQNIGETSIHQINVSPKMANLSKGVENNASVAGASNALAAATGVLGIASTIGELKLNGGSVQGNANLPIGARVESLAQSVQLFLHNGCQFVLAPQSAATVTSETQVTLEKGAIRGEPFAKCNVVSGGLKVAGVQDTSEGVVRLAGGKVQVAAIDGAVQVVNADGSVVGNVAAGSASLFGGGTAVASGSGASAGVGITDKTAITVAIAVTAAAGAAAGAAAVVNSPSTSR